MLVYKHFHWCMVFTLIALLLAVWTSTQAQEEGLYQGRLIDAHSHLPTPLDGQTYDMVADEMIAQMDQAGIEVAFIYGLKADYSGQEDRDILAQARRYPGRLIPFLSGFDPGDPASVEYVSEQLATGEWKGLGELYIRHSPDWVFPADGPVLMEIYQLAGQYGVPVAIHFEPDLQLERAAGEAELENALRANPNTTFLLLHGSFGFATPERLAAFPNLYLVREILPGEPLFGPEGLPPAENSRTSVGTDLVSTQPLFAPSQWSYAEQLNGLRQALGQLPPEQTEAAAYQTILKLVPLNISPQADSGVPSAATLPIEELQWVRTGGPPGGLGYDIRYSFADPNIWYVTDNNAGVHISTDNGYTWQPSNTGIPPQAGATGDAIPIFSLTVDPHNPQIIWAGTNPTGHIYKSTDGGHTWAQKDNGVTIDYAGGLTFRGFTVDPHSSDIVYAMGETSDPIIGFAVWGAGTGGVVYKTTDGGEHWQEIWDGGMPSSLARYLWVDPRDSNVLYVSTGIFDRGAVGEGDPNTDPDPFGGVGILKSTDGGQTWRFLNEANGLNNLYVGSLYMHPDNPDILLAATGHLVPALVMERMLGEHELSTAGVYRTTDGGEHWTQVLAPPIERVGETFTSVELCPSDPNIAYAGSAHAIYRSEDAGQTWALVSGGEQPWGPPGIMAGWPIDMQCDPRDTNRVFANNYNGGNFLSEDGGRTWQNASQGYTGAQIRSVAVDPTNPARVYAAGRSGLWRSDDGGITWNGLGAGLEWMTIAVDPAQPDHVLAGFGSIVETQDSGTHWDNRGNVESVLGNASAGGVLRVAFAPSDPSVVYGGIGFDFCVQGHEAPACTNASGSIIISSDGGTTWKRIEDRVVGGATILDLAVDPTNAQIVYAAASSGPFKTTDGGTSWTPLGGLPNNALVRAVAVSPADSQHVLVGIEAVGVYVSADGGQTWQPGIAGLEANGSLHDIVFDPTDPQVVYASDFRSGVYRSTDGGLTWLRVNQGLHNRAVMGLSISTDGQHLYVAVDGDGVYRLDLNGVPPSAGQ